MAFEERYKKIEKFDPETAEDMIIIDHVTKQFKVFYDKGTSLKEKMLFKKRNRYENRVVLNDISLTIKRGEAVGLIGHNGCGKSTLLKLMTRILYPESGEVVVKGRVSSLIELGAGFHPDMSGRENIYTNASIFGLSKKEIDQRIEKIIRFSELEEFIDNPVRTYSSGMYMRLAFSVAINVDADVLLIDEILAVGDANFQAKCFAKLQEIKAEGTTIVIVSHSLSQIEEFCDRSIWIHDGKFKADGKPRIIHPVYLNFMAKKRNEQKLKERQLAKGEAPDSGEDFSIPDEILNTIEQVKQEKERKAQEEKEKAEKAKREAEEKAKADEEERIRLQKEAEEREIQEAIARAEAEAKELAERKRWGNYKVEIVDARVFDTEGNENYVYHVGDSLTLKIDYKVNEPIEDAVFGFAFYRADQLLVYGSNTMLEHFDKFDLVKDGTIEIKFPCFNLIPGKYTVDLAIEYDRNVAVDYHREMFSIETYATTGDVGVVRLQHDFNLGDVKPHEN